MNLMISDKKVSYLVDVEEARVCDAFHFFLDLVEGFVELRFDIADPCIDRVEAVKDVWLDLGFWKRLGVVEWNVDLHL